MAEAELSDVAEWIRKEASYGQEHNLLPGETYFSDSIALRTTGTGGIWWSPTPGWQEAKKGCDYEVLLQLPGRDWWWRLAVQAKRLYQSGRYDGMEWEQLNTLETYADKIGALPAYSFYNHSVPHNWTDFWSCSCNGSQELLGWTICPSWLVRWAMNNHGKRKFAPLHRPSCSMSFRCLLHGTGTTGGRIGIKNDPSDDEQQERQEEWVERFSGVVKDPLPNYTDLLMDTEMKPRRLVLIGADEDTLRTFRASLEEFR